MDDLRDESTGEVLGLNSPDPLSVRTVLHEAVMLARPQAVQFLLDNGADPNIGHSTQVLTLFWQFLLTLG